MSLALYGTYSLFNFSLFPNVAFWFSVFRGFKREHQEENSEKVFFDRTLFIDFPLNFFTQS